MSLQNTDILPRTSLRINLEIAEFDKIAVANAASPSVPPSSQNKYRCNSSRSRAMSSSTSSDRLPTGWWKTRTAYQVWPASYKDSNGDGWGDIPGIISTLDHLQTLGIDLIWLSPMYKSPDVDMGYDISDYQDVNPRFGTLADMDDLIREMHGRGMKLILDLVINHTSNEHAWFVDSASGKGGEKSDWYIWRKPKYVDGERQPPNNWRSIFGGSAWEYVAARDEYYLHLFCIEQPDLNWENPVTRKAIFESAIEFWLKKGVDGFRVDAVNLYCKDTAFPDAAITDPDSKYQRAEQYYINGPKMHPWLEELRQQACNKYGDVMLVGELPHTKTREAILSYVSASAEELSIVHDFDTCDLGKATDMHNWIKPTVLEFKDSFAKSQHLIDDSDAWTTIFVENHDQARAVDRFVTRDPKHQKQASKLLAMLIGSLSGVLFIYQGEEIGMVNVPKSWGPEEYKDVAAVNYWKEMNERYPGNKEMLDKALAGLQYGGRDNARTPVQWSGEKNAGFTTGKPWMRVNDNYHQINVESQKGDPDSVLTFYTQMLKIRKQNVESMVKGSYELVDADNPQTFTFVKKVDGSPRLLVCLNFTDSDQAVFVPEDLKGKTRKLLITNAAKTRDTLGPFEGKVFLVS